MTFWMREFENTKTGQRFRVHSEVGYIPLLREAVAMLQNDSAWTDDTIYRHDARFDIRRDGDCTFAVVAL